MIITKGDFDAEAPTDWLSDLPYFTIKNLLSLKFNAKNRFKTPLFGTSDVFYAVESLWRLGKQSIGEKEIKR